MSLGLNTAAGISAVMGGPLAAVPVGLTIRRTIISFHPKYKLRKWNIRIEHIANVVASKGDMITREEMKKFLRVLKL
jgi:hypothetical protein